MVVAAAVEDGAVARVVVLAGRRRIGVRLTATVLTATSFQASSTVIVYSKSGLTLGTQITCCNYRGECARKPDEKNCMNPTPQEVIKILDVSARCSCAADLWR
jgi:hypothetical protein